MIVSAELGQPRRHPGRHQRAEAARRRTATRPPICGPRGRCSTSRCSSPTRCATSSGATAVPGRERRSRFNASFILGGQISGEPMRLFRIYAEGNFIEAGTDTPFFQTGETKYGKPIIDRVITRSHHARRRHQMRAGVVRFDHAQQPVGGHADRPDLLRAGQPRGAHAPPIRRGRSLFHRAQRRMERRRAAGVPPAARVAAGETVATVRYLPHHLRARRQPDTRALSPAVSGTTGAAGFPSRLRPRGAGHGEGARQGIQSAAGDRPPSAGCSSISIARSAIRNCFRRATRGAPARRPGADRRAVLPALSRAGRASRRASGVARASA